MTALILNICLKSIIIQKFPYSTDFFPLFHSLVFYSIFFIFLGEPKPTRTNPGRLPRFMVAISDRIAVWIENAVYRADAIEPLEAGGDEHIRLDAEKAFV